MGQKIMNRQIFIRVRMDLILDFQQKVLLEEEHILQ